MRQAYQSIAIKRIYEPKSDHDGRRVLVDRLWPRGVSKEQAQVDDWMREIAPSPTLRQWFGHDPARFPQFREEYRKELQEDPHRLERIQELLEAAHKAPLTLLYAAKDERCNHAAVLHELLLEKL